MSDGRSDGFLALGEHCDGAGVLNGKGRIRFDDAQVSSLLFMVLWLNNVIAI